MEFKDMGVTKTEEQLRRFLWTEYSERVGDCLLWRGRKSRLGYGAVTYKRKSWKVHRLSWFLANGPIPPGLDVLHTCDNRACVNPEHLWTGTHRDNMVDMMAKGRGGQPRGSRHGRAKVTELLVQEIRRRYAEGSVSQSELARDYGITQSVVGKIVLRQTWRHVP